MILESIKILKTNHTFAQKINYIKYLFSPKKVILNYDPITISIVPTGRCTLSCDMCPTHSKIIPNSYPYIQEPVKDMDIQTFKQIIDRFHKALNVHIIGSGEPMLNKDFFDMVDYAYSKKMKVKTFSNGTIIDENIDKIVNSKLDGITISINSYNSEDYHRMTGNDKEWYEKIYNSTKRLVYYRNKVNSKVKIKLSFILDKINYIHIPDMINVGLDINADMIFLCNFLPSPYDGFKVEERTLIKDEKVISTLKKFFNDLTPDLRKRILFPPVLDIDSEFNQCKTHFYQIRINGDGDVSSCSMMLLNMKNKGHFLDKDVWNNEFFQEMRQRFIKNDRNILEEPCKVCIENLGIKPYKK